ncbi:cbb3-type cytochrome c oxidase subunit I, partial [Enterobacter hormaechei]|uniref:cbb3-type cytochrome c oxidase subunit I n=1 Tax=Enterobacter hormaechei TaxID=158836 RepID=UPI00197AC6E1
VFAWIATLAAGKMRFNTPGLFAVGGLVIFVMGGFTTGMPRISTNYFSAASMAVSVPAGVQVFAWIATLAAGKMRFNTPGLFAVGGLVIFVMGG